MNIDGWRAMLMPGGQIMFGMLKRLVSGNDSALLEGFWCETTVKLPQKLTTPLGGKVTVVRVCVDIRYSVDGNNIKLQKVAVSGSGRVGESPINMSADRTGEARYARSMGPNSVLVQVVEHDLDNPKSRLRKLMLRQWDELHPPADDGNPFTPGRQIEFTYSRMCSTALCSCSSTADVTA